MARVIVSREARNDLVSIRDYIRDELCNPDAARRILAQLKRASPRWNIIPVAANLWMR